LPGVPKWSGWLTADYNFAFPGGHPAHVGAGWRYVDERRTGVLETSVPPVQDQTYVMPSYDAVDLNADVSFDRLTVRLFVKNLTDERAYTGGGLIVNLLDQPVQEELGVLQPRTYGISLDFTF